MVRNSILRFDPLSLFILDEGGYFCLDKASFFPDDPCPSVEKRDGDHYLLNLPMSSIYLVS